MIEGVLNIELPWCGPTPRILSEQNEQSQIANNLIDIQGMNDCMEITFNKFKCKPHQKQRIRRCD